MDEQCVSSSLNWVASSSKTQDRKWQHLFQNSIGSYEYLDLLNLPCRFHHPLSMFCMEEAVLIDKDLYIFLDQLPSIILCCSINKRMIRFVGNHDFHIYTRGSCDFKAAMTFHQEQGKVSVSKHVLAEVINLINESLICSLSLFGPLETSWMDVSASLDSSRSAFKEIIQMIADLFFRYRDVPVC